MDRQTQRDREKESEYEQCPPQGREMGVGVRGGHVRRGAQVPYVTTGWGRAGGMQGGRRREGAQSSLRPPAVTMQAQGRQDAGP